MATDGYSAICDQRTEAVLLGSLLNWPDKRYEYASGLLRPSDFYYSGYGLIFQTMADLYRRGIMPDAEAVRDELQAHDAMAKIGGVHGGTCEFTDILALGSPAPVSSLVHLVLEKAKARAIQYACLAALGNLGQSLAPEEVAARLKDACDLALSRGASEQPITTLPELAGAWAAALETEYSGDQSFITTGFQWLDEAIGGFGAGRLLILGARPNTGKSRVMIYMLASAARSGHMAGLINLDMAASDLLNYVYPIVANVYGQDVRINDFKHPRGWGAFERTRVRDVSLAASPDGRFLLVKETRKRTLAAIRFYVAAMVNRGAKVVGLDQLQRIEGWASGAENRALFAEIMDGLADMAREYRVTILAAHQINRTGLLLDSGKVEEFSDGIIELQDEISDVTDKPVIRDLTMKLNKTRMGTQGGRRVKFDFARGVRVKAHPAEE